MKFLLITLIITFFIFANGGGIWPHPANIAGGNLNYQISPQITFQITSNSNSLLLSSIERYKKYIVPTNNYSGKSDGTITQIQLSITNNTTNLQLGISEKYILNISQPVSYIYADTVFGAMRALESFSQLLHDNKDGSSNIDGAPYYILDEPRFLHRGLMIDTARHYLPLDVIFRAIDGLSYLKMNVLHWHVTDAQSYPMRWKSYPEFSIKGSWSEDSYYTPQNVTAVVQYGLERGIRILPEFDMPGHSYSLGLAYNNMTAKCPAYYINVDNVPLDPSNEFVYQVMDSVIAEMSSYWLDDYIHLGGDEVVYDCWTADSKISQWMNQMGFTPNQAMQYFENKVQAIAQKYGKKVINWEEVFTCGINVPSTTVIEVWMDEQTLLKVANAGKGAILAYGWYLDHLQDNWVTFYTQEPFNSPDWNTTNKQFVLGGEACAWGEQINFSNFDSRVWTRTSATAERLWSPKEINVPYQAAPRLMQHICRLNARGILAEPISPGTC